MGIKVTLRQANISKGRQSLYLDFYPAIPHPETGKPTRREYLGIYLIDKPKNPIDKQSNKEKLQIGESIRQLRENHLNKPEIYSGYEKEQLRVKELGEQCFVKYFKRLTDKRNGSSYQTWVSAYKYLDLFTNGGATFASINERFLEEFKEYLLSTKSNKSEKTTLSPNSAASYFGKVKAALKQAYKDGFLFVDLNSRTSPMTVEETHRNVLTIEELNSLINTDCRNPLMKRVALFSALTGMRFSDIAGLVWSNIEYNEGDGYSIRFRQKKTKGIERLPIPKQAFELMGEPGEPDGRVFEGLKYSAYQNRHLYQWIGAAGITKDITFHCFRHTYATLQMLNGTDIYTVSKMLGHRDLKTTQIYAKVVDETKRKATEKITLDL